MLLLWIHLHRHAVLHETTPVVAEIPVVLPQ